MNSCREKFKHNFVKPLYRPKCKEVKPNNKVEVMTHSVIDLDGSEIRVNRKVVSDKNGPISVYSHKTREDIAIAKRFFLNNYVNNNNSKRNTKNASIAAGKRFFSKDFNMLKDMPESVKNINSNLINFYRGQDVWLRMHPLPKQPQESFYSVLFRCIFCILGLYSFIIIWTIILVFVIHSFEGPYEKQISIDFEENQKQLIIDLATELRLITPLSRKWKDAITKRMEDERQLTIVAMARGAKLRPGEFWDLSGTFLFTVYVMTTLGFGAPVPHTLGGRTFALLYALLAVPTHFYLKLNISACIIAHADVCCNNLKNKFSKRKSFVGRKSTLEMKSQNPNCSTDSDISQSKCNSCFRRVILRILNIVCTCRCMPFINLLYYVCGALVFGWSRNKQPLEVVMFPLEFTATGGLELVAGHVRILYALYLKGAIILLACLLSTLMKNCGSTINNMFDKHKLFTNIHVK